MISRQRILVTGAGGYIGRHVVAELVRRELPVTAVGRHLTASDFDPSVRVLTTDVLAAPADLDRELDETATLVHLAYEQGFALESEIHALRLSAHYQFLVHAADSGVPRIATAGTMHEIGYWEGAVDEATPRRPTSIYGIAKDSLRRLLTATFAKKESQLLWMRFFYILGDDRRNQSIFAKILQAADEGRETFPFTSGTNRYDFIDVDDLAHKIVTAVVSDAVGEVNCCSGLPISLGERVEQFIGDNGLNIRLEYGAFPDRSSDSPGIWGDGSRIREIESLQLAPNSGTGK